MWVKYKGKVFIIYRDTRLKSEELKRVEELSILYTLENNSPGDEVTPSENCSAETEGSSARYCLDQESEMCTTFHSCLLIDKLFDIGKHIKER